MTSELEDVLRKALQNATSDRETSMSIFKELHQRIVQGAVSPENVAKDIAKHIETLQRSNEQVIKIASLILKRDISDGGVDTAVAIDEIIDEAQKEDSKKGGKNE